MFHSEVMMKKLISSIKQNIGYFSATVYRVVVLNTFSNKML